MINLTYFSLNYTYIYILLYFYCDKKIDIIYIHKQYDTSINITGMFFLLQASKASNFHNYHVKFLLLFKQSIISDVRDKKMVMEASPSPQNVGREFVRQYYTLLNQAPAHLHR